MSGVVALLDRGRGAVDRRVLGLLNERMGHRGPDGSDTFLDEGVGLGHQHLLSTPEGRYDDQPYREGGVTITGDVRLDNRGELLSVLSPSDPPRQVPDSRLVLAAYRKWGPDCVEHLLGDFAFAIQDGNWLFCARDRFGVKPLYYHCSPETFAAASEQKALLAHPDVPGRVDEKKVGDFLLDTHEDTARTFFESIDRLPPAHAMLVFEDEVERWQYWDLDPTRTITLESDAAYERRFRDLFEQAVGSRLRAAGPVGAALSGGMDSSSITVVARDLLPADRPLHTFSNVFDDAPESDEREFIEAVVDREGIEPHYVFLDDEGVLGDEAGTRTYVDQPPHNTMHVGDWRRTERAHETGVNAFLGGALGDSAIGYGLGLLPELLWTGRWAALYRELSAMAAVVGAPPKHLFRRHALAEVLPEGLGALRDRVQGGPTGLDAVNPTLDPAFVDRIGLTERYAEHDGGGATFRPRSRRRQRRSLLTGKNASNFETLDLVHAAFGIEPRYPFADKRLVEFSLAIPPTQQFADGWTRSIARRALSDLLPEKIQWRPWKTFLNQAFWNALERDRDRIEALIDDPGPLASYLDPDALAAASERFADDPTSRDARALWRALSLSVWLDEYESHRS